MLIMAPASALASERLRLEPVKEEAPVPLSAAIRESLRPEGLRILDAKGKPRLDIWLRKSVETHDAERRQLGVDFAMVKEGELLGAIRFHAGAEDFRGDSFPAGVYTLRKVTQPEDGDHLGVSETRDFGLLCRPGDDDTSEPLSGRRVSRLSQKVSGTKHPSCFYLLKMFDEPEKLPRLVEDAEREFWILDVEIPNEAKDKKGVRFGLVVVGEAKEY